MAMVTNGKYDTFMDKSVPELSDISRQSYVELTLIAHNMVRRLEKAGIKPHEYITLIEVMNRLWYLKKEAPHASNRIKRTRKA